MKRKTNRQVIRRRVEIRVSRALSAIIEARDAIDQHPNYFTVEDADKVRKTIEGKSRMIVHPSIRPQLFLDAVNEFVSDEEATDD